MKTTDFIKENFVADAAEAHQDHEVQMARADCYNAAKYAIELHKLLKNISEQEGLDGWVSEKITLANDYLRTVTEYLRYEHQAGASDMPEFDVGSATQTLDAALGESTIQEGAFTWYLKAHGRLLSPSTSDNPYTFKSKEEAIAFAKEKYKTNWQNIVPTPYDVPNSLENQPDAGWDEKRLKPVAEDDYDDAVSAFLAKNTPIQGKTHKPRASERLGGSRHIGGGGEKMKASRTGIGSMPTGKAVAGQAKLGEGIVGTVGFPDDEGTHTGNQPIVRLGGTFPARPKVEDGSLVKVDGLDGVWRVNRIRGDAADVTMEIPNTAKSTRVPVKDCRVWTNKPVKEQDVAEGSLDESPRRVNVEVTDKGAVYVNDTRITGRDTKWGSHNIIARGNRISATAVPRWLAKNGFGDIKLDPVYAAEFGIPVEQGVAEGTKEVDMTGKKCSACKKGTYQETSQHDDMDGVLHCTKCNKQVNRWKNYKEQGVAESAGGMGAASVATSMGGGNGFVNGGPGTISRPKMKKKK